MKKIFYSLLLLVAMFFAQTLHAQAPVATPEKAIEGLLTRIGGSSAPGKFEIVIDESLAEGGKDVFIITEKGGKPCIKGNTQLSVATGINWYLNHYAHINLTWNNLTTDLSAVSLPVPSQEEKHVCNTTYRYDFNTCTFSYSMAFWTWERWQQEIDWMALHGINAPLNLVGLDVVTRLFLQELGVSEDDIDAYIAGPGFIAWFAMNNLEGWGGTIESSSTGVYMKGNPDWWYTRQEQLCRNMLQRMRELGMQPVIPGFSGQVPNCIVNYSIPGFSSGDVVNNGTWAGGYTRPDILKPNTNSYVTFAEVYYKHLHNVMGVSEFYSIDPFHEGSLPSGVSNATCYPNIMKELDNYYNDVTAADKAKYNVDEAPKWIIQYWQGVPQSGAFSAMSSYGDRFIGLDLFADNIYADNAAKWRTNYYQGRPYIYCMLHNFGGRSGLHGRLLTTFDGYFEALAKGNNMQGVGATPEGTETNPILYDMLFELPWMDVNNRPTADEWLEDYAYSRYGVQNEKALAALQNLKESVWKCEVNQQGTSEAVILARPNWSIGSVSSWSTSAIYWDTQNVLLAADQLISIADEITTADGTANYNYDVIDVIRQSMVDYAAKLLPLISAARNTGNTTEYTRLYNLYLQLMLDLDTMLSYDENFKLERWTSLARNIADEVEGTTENDRNWLEWNARTQVTVWSKGDTDLHDYSNRCWAGLIKDFHYKRWKQFFENNGNAFSGGWYSGFEYPWTVDFNGTYNLAGDYSKIVIPTDMTATEKAVQTFGNYFGRIKGIEKNYIFPMGVSTDATGKGIIPEVYRGQTVELPLIIGKNTAIASVWIDLNNDGAAGSGENLTATDGQVNIPANAAIGQTRAIVTYNDGTSITFDIALIEDITEERTVTAASAGNGSVSIEGTNGNTITNAEAVKIYATANTGYNFERWTDANGNTVSNNNPYIYYGKESASFTANFIQDKWGVVELGENTMSGDIASYGQFIHQLTFAYYNREAETIFETTDAPTSIFTTIPKIVNVPQGASFDVEYNNGTATGLQYCYLRAYIDLNADGDFDDEGELLKTVGTNGAANTAVCSNKMNVLLPYDAPLGITHMRLRFDGAWNSPESKGAKDSSIRPVYDLIINITDKSSKAAEVKVLTNSEEWGTVEVWTDETPDGSTGTVWNVSSNIPFYLRATKTSDDVEFLGWYDQYGRLVTTELNHTMYAREDATYTAKFRKFLTIDGWEIEYRTEQGATSATRLADGAAPSNGKTYYIAAHVKQSSDYNNYYLYDNGGTLKSSTTLGDENFLWTCIENGDNTYSFVNESGNYLANNSSYHISIGATAAKYKFEAAVHEGVSLCNYSDGYTGSRYMVTSGDGASFNRNSTKRNDTSWSSDYILYEVSTGENVILTNVRKTGSNDLVIPATVEVLGEECTIVGFDNNLFNNNTELWSITLPSTMQFLSQKSLLNGTMTGTVASGAGTENAQYYTIYNLEEAITVADGFKVTVTGISDGSTYNQWGSGLFATGTNPLASTYNDGFQFYLAKAGNFVLKIDNGDEYALDNSECKVIAGTPFTATIEYVGNTITITVDNGNGQTGVYTRNNVTLADISAFSAAIPTGITLNVEVETEKEGNPFSGCSNLDKIAFDGTCAAYYVNDEGDLYNAADLLVCSPEGKEKGADRRALSVLIEQMETLTSKVATYNPAGATTKIALQTGDPNAANYLWTNNAETSEGNIAHLVDGIKGQNNNFFHSNWHSVSTTEGYHYIEVDLGADNAYTIMQFAYHTRTGCSNDFPDAVTVMGSNDKQSYTTLHTENENLPQSTNQTFTSASFDCGKPYRYLRFRVDAERTYWHMGEFELYACTPSADVFTHLEAGITNEQAAAGYNALQKAIAVYNNGTTTAAQMKSAVTTLQSAYNTLLALFNGANPVEITMDEENPVLYKIFIKRTADVTVLKYDHTDSKVAIQNTADNNSWQAWYFTKDENGVYVHPYNANGKVLGAASTNNSPGTVSAAEKGEQAYDTWKFVSRADGYYNIQASNESNYFSNNGGVNNKMGFWSGDPAGDTGSLFKFVKATFDNDNARFYQLSDVKSTMTDGTNIYGGTSVGLYTGGTEYREAYTKAGEIVAAGSSTSNSDACYAAYTTLLDAKENLSYNKADASKVYYIKSAATNSYCAGKYVHTYSSKNTNHNNYSHKHLVFKNLNEISNKTLAMFQFEETGTQGQYKMKCLHTGMYVKTFLKNDELLGTAEEAKVVKINALADGQVTLKIGDERPMHAQEAYSVIVDWDAAVGNASAWTIEEVTNPEDMTYNVTVTSADYATLYLNYNVTVPSGFKAFYAEEIKDNKYVNLYEVVDVIPARTPVIIKSNTDLTASQIAPFKFAGNTPVAFDEYNMLEGTLYDKVVDGISNNIHLLKNGSSGIAMYHAYAEYSDNGTIADGNAGTDNGGYVKVSANKSYLVVPASQGSSMSYIFNFNGISTDINEIEAAGAVKGIYDLQGRKIDNITAAGYYIIDGKLVFVNEVK